MEALGSAAGVFAVVSVADQLADRIKQLYNFWSAVSEAPANISALAAGLQPLLGILTQISNDGQKYGNDTSTTDVLKQCLSHVTALIGITENLEKGFESSSKRQRKWSAIKAVFNEDKIASFRSEIADLKSTLTLAQVRMLSRSSNAHFEEQKLSTSLLQESFAKLSASENEKLAQISESDRNACISAFYLSDVTSKLDGVPKREPGTCEWVTKHRKYQAWVDSPTSELLWLSGIPGCGKTVISSFIIQSLRTKPDILPIYFMCDDKLENFRSKEDVMRSIIHQLLTQDANLVRHAINHFRQMKDSVASSSATLWIIFVDILKDKYRTNPIYLVLDALDESENESREWILEKLGQLFSLDNGTQTTFQPSSPFKILVTSRPWEDIEFGFRSLTRIRLKTEVEDGIQEDIDVFIASQVRALVKRCRYTTLQQTLITDTLRSKANGMFLWVSLVVKDLLRTPAKSIEQRLNLLPKTLNQVYESLLSKIDESSTERIKNILMWVMTAYRPLSLEELALACELPSLSQANPTNMEDLVNALIWDIGLCGPILYIRYRFVYLVHQSAKDYLLNESFHQGQHATYADFKFKSAESHRKITGLCLRYLKLPDLETGAFAEERTYFARHARGPTPPITPARYAHLDDYALLSYSARYWPTHFVESDSTSLEAVLDFFKRPILLEAWFDLFCLYSFPRNTSTPYYNGSSLHVAMYLGLPTIIGGLLDDPVTELNGTDRNGYTPLLRITVGWLSHHQPVLERNEIDILKNLLSAAVDLEATTKQSFHTTCRTSLHLAALGKNHEKVAILLNAGASVDARDGEDSTPLHLALQYGDPKCLPTAQLLLDHGADPDAYDYEGFTPLSTVIFWDHDAELICNMITILLNAGADINKEIEGKSTISSVPDMSLEPDVLRHLFKHGAKLLLSTEDSDQTRLLYDAVIQEDHSLISLLLKAGADMHNTYYGRVSALKIAICNGEEKIVEMFSAHQPHSTPNIDNQNLCMTQLHRAVLDGNSALTSDFMASGLAFDFEEEDSNGMSILVQSVQTGHLSMVKLVLDGIKNLAPENSQNAKMVKALWLAALMGNDSIASLLIDSGAPLDGELLSIVYVQVQVKWLAGRSTYDFRDEHWSPLLVASMLGNESVVELLLTKGANQDASCSGLSKGETALELAARYGHAGVVKMLLGYTTRKEPELIWKVCDLGHEHLVSILVRDGGYDIEDTCYSNGQTALSSAASRGKSKGVLALLGESASIASTDDRCLNCLHHAVIAGNTSIAEIFIEYGADIEAITPGKHTALFLAAQFGHLEIFKMLLAKRAGIFIVDSDGDTPLHAAAGKGNEAIIKLLLENGADFKVRNDLGLTPLKLAVSQRHRVVAGMLMEWEEEHTFL